tara:strand:- start:1713 stop:2102 length:390 start_codon:yes stop_codon:yes gene_type:complete
MSEKRKLKYPHQRRPKEVVKFTEFTKEISKRTGFTTVDIKKVWRVGIDIIIENMVNKKSVLFPQIGMFYPAIKTARTVMSLNGGIGIPKPIKMPSRWIIKFRPGNYVREKLLEQDPTEKEVDNLYRDDN